MMTSRSTTSPEAWRKALDLLPWLVTAYLERLVTDPQASLPGATGRLRIDAQGNVLRSPAWSTWSGNVVVPLANAGG